jgi:phosphoribosylformylglycinamidine synthase
MDYTAEVRIELKNGVLDAEGETVGKSLKLLGFPVKGVRSVKAYELSLEAASIEDAHKKAENAAKKLLANPVIQNYIISVNKAKK